VADKKIEVSKIRSTYIQLPFYYAEVNGLKILVNGQTGDITINSKEYLKNQKRMVFLGVILIFAAMGIYLYGREILLHVLGFLLSWSYVLIVLVPIGIELYLTFRKKKQRYIRKIIYKKQKELSVWEEIERARVIPQKQNSIDSTDSKGCSIIVSAMMGIWFLIMVIFVIKIVMQ